MKGNFCRPRKERHDQAAHSGYLYSYRAGRETGPGTEGVPRSSHPSPSCFPGPSRLFPLSLDDDFRTCCFSLLSPLRSVADPPFHLPAATSKTLRVTSKHCWPTAKLMVSTALDLQPTCSTWMFVYLSSHMVPELLLTSPPPGRLSLLFHCACPRSSLLLLPGSVSWLMSPCPRAL